MKAEFYRGPGAVKGEDGKKAIQEVERVRISGHNGSDVVDRISTDADRARFFLEHAAFVAGGNLPSTEPAPAAEAPGPEPVATEPKPKPKRARKATE